MTQQRITRNKAVFFTYLIKTEDGVVHEQSDMPIGYVHGANSDLLPKLEQALEGHTAGETIEVPISPAEGFGEHDPDLTFTDDIANVPPELRRIGAEAEMQNENGDVKTFIVTKIENGKLTVDGNHPFAGKNIIYRVTITDVRDATPAEMASGYPEGQLPPGSSMH
jgi:FKBP-type peptidyl-prolyl cis-trans isomerase SlyD